VKLMGGARTERFYQSWQKLNEIPPLVQTWTDGRMTGVDPDEYPKSRL
jgi:hypothetical protein